MFTFNQKLKAYSTLFSQNKIYNEIIFLDWNRHFNSYVGLLAESVKPLELMEVVYFPMTIPNCNFRSFVKLFLLRKSSNEYVFLRQNIRYCNMCL